MTEPLFEAAWQKDTARPWHRQSQKIGARTSVESTAAFVAFKVYCELGEDRSHVKVAQQCGKNVSLISRWSVRWRWLERCRAFDDHLDELRLRAIYRERTKMAERQARTAVLGQALVVQGLQQLLADLAQAQLAAKHGKNPPRVVSADELARMFDVCSKVERICRGEPDVNAVASINVVVVEREQSRAEEAKQLPAIAQEVTDLPN